MVIKKSESIGSPQTRRKMASLGRNNLDDSHKCLYLSTPYFRCTQNPSTHSYLPTFPISIFLSSKAGGSHPIHQVISGNANIHGIFSAPDVHHAEGLNTSTLYAYFFKKILINV